MLHIPLLRRGHPYRSLDFAHAPHCATGKPFVEISHANAGLIRRDLLQQDSMREALLAIPASRLIEMTAAAAPIFLNDTLPLGETSQRPDDYVQQLSATTGMPHAMVRRNMQRVASVMTNIGDIVRGLTRGLDLAVIDRGYSIDNGKPVSFFPKSRALGVVLPSNSPGVHGLWIPAIAMKMPLVLRPGSAEPWTPFRIIQALMKAGVPADAFSYLPSDHAGAGEIVRRCGRSMFFGDVGAVGAFAGDPRIELHGPGYSKVLLGPDRAADWRPSLALIAKSIADNGGRSCVNASGVWTPANGRDLADALASRLSSIVPRPADDPAAEIAPFVNCSVAHHINNQIDAGLAEPGAEDMSARYRKGPRLVELNGSTYLLPTIVHCTSSSHPLANREFLFPFASVVDIAAAEVPALPAALGPTLSMTALTDDAQLIERLLQSELVGRLNIGAIQTNTIVWDQPHEGNLFEHLYARRAFQRAG
ncbi:MAG TPA: aldehyde dehydrogenase family protein [Vicinamibacterales bacterium]|nr:aldehyde dehydrogenase family protein [Vicinamibacterales bacterium]